MKTLERRARRTRALALSLSLRNPFQRNRRAHATDALGSIWTGGVGGWGVEFHMKFDFSFFNQSRLDLLDYCEESSSGICTADECDMSDIA